MAGVRHAFRARLRPADDDLGLDAALWRGVDAFRGFSLLYAVGTFAVVWQEYRRPGAAVLVLLAMAAWTVYVWLRRTRPSRLVVADLVASCLAVLATLVVDDPARIGAGASTLALTWPAASVLAWAIWRGWLAGVVAALAVGVADVLVSDPVNGSTLHNIVLLLLAGAVVGYAADLYRRSRRTLATALQVEAATRERERLARDIHDSVLQVLAYVQRRGGELGGEAAELGRLAGEQEGRLRTLVSASSTGLQAGDADLLQLVGAHVPTGTQLSAPGQPVLLPLGVAEELTAAVGAALDNVGRHAGPAARAWVLVEDDVDEVIVTVRDDGVGIAPGRLEEAERQGRLGVASSVRGRVEDLGGTVDIVTAPGAGTEVEMRVPRAARSDP